MTVPRLLSEHYFKSLKQYRLFCSLALRFWACTAVCGNSFSAVLNKLFTDDKRVITYSRKAQFVRLVFELNLTKITERWVESSSLAEI